MTQNSFGEYQMKEKKSRNEKNALCIYYSVNYNLCERAKAIKLRFYHSFSD